jgi:hypothetical protein
LATGQANAIFRSYFNRVAGGTNTDTQFIVGIFSFTGSPPTFASQIDNNTFLASSSTQLLADNDVDTWEPAQTTLLLSANTEFIALYLSAHENVLNNTVGQVEFDGHYADATSFELTTIPEPTTFALFALGILGMFCYLRRRKET